MVIFVKWFHEVKGLINCMNITLNSDRNFKISYALNRSLNNLNWIESPWGNDLHPTPCSFYRGADLVLWYLVNFSVVLTTILISVRLPDDFFSSTFLFPEAIYWCLLDVLIFHWNIKPCCSFCDQCTCNLGTGSSSFLGPQATGCHVTRLFRFCLVHIS